MTGLPSTSIYCFGMLAPIREPTPPERIIAIFIKTIYMEFRIFRQTDHNIKVACLYKSHSLRVHFS